METVDGLAPTLQQEVDGSTQDLANLDISTSSQSIASNKKEANVVYRVTGIPIDYGRKRAETLLQTVLQLDKAGDSVKLRSIAISPNRKTKVATVCFSYRPIPLPKRDDGEWHFPIPTGNSSGNSSADDDGDNIPQEQSITVDTHFKGLTVLKSFSNLDDHKIDIIAISGLGGHAFGSFKERGGQHMWLCDSLRHDLPGAQIIIYGYDTQLHGSTSFQDLESLASSFRASITAQRTLGSIDAKPRTVPLVFIAHSLGGLLVKEAIIQMKGDKKHEDLLESIYGALFFGVPSEGMEITSLIPMVADQRNQLLLLSLGTESELLRKQTRNFAKAFGSEESEIFCYYETEMSPTAKLTENETEPDVWDMKGPPCILVGSRSATHTRPGENEAHNCRGMKRDHSALVKFSRSDSDYDEVLAKLKRMTLTAVSTIPRGTRRHLKQKQLTEEEKKAIEDSLKFDRMETRFFDVGTATSTTCNWLFSIPEYRQWLDIDLVSEHHGFIWIKGKPGSGKSTIMKHALKDAKNAAPLSIIITFFFNARGSTKLEKSILGMYRSVLLQLISKIPTILDDLSQLFYTKIKHGKVYEWNIGELQEILIGIMKRHHEYPVMWFIDALDECKANEVLKLIEFFEEIAQAAVSSRSRLHICLSTRHYPNISIRWGIQLTLEEQDGHDQDIMTYIDSEFRAPHNPHVARIKSELRSRSSGVFMWVRLVVELLNAAFRRGEGKPAQLQQLLESVPKKLDDLFTNILKADPESKDKSILCFQLLSFSKEPLTLPELYFAVQVGTDPTAIGKWDIDEISPESIKDNILYISKGLVEVSKWQGTVQFIHESVRDFFLLHDGFTKLEPNLATNVEGFGEERLKHCCYQYMVLGVFKDSYCSPAQQRLTQPTDIDEEINDQIPFACYAVQYVFAHAEVAQGCGIDQREFITNFESPDRTLIKKWMMLHNDIQGCFTDAATMQYGSNDGLIYILSSQNLPELVLILIQNKGNVNSVGKQEGSPLQLAARKGYLTIAQLLIAAGADIEFYGGEYESSPLFSALYFHHLDVALLLLENGARHDIVTESSQTPFIVAAEEGLMAVVQKLLQLGTNVNIEGGRALQGAAKRGHLQIVQLLLKLGANLNLECERYGTALQAAASNGNCQIVQLLLQSGADANSGSGDHYGDPLQAAASNGDVQIVQLLLQSGANVNSKKITRGSALQMAVYYRHVQVVQLLLHAEANINSMSEGSGSALQVAASMGDERMVRLLLQAGADVNSVGGYYGNALQAAVIGRNEQVVLLFLQLGANANSGGGYYRNALRAPVCFTTGPVVRPLLHTVAEVNSMGERSGSALQVAATNGDERMVWLLLHAGADVNGMGGYYGDALQAAVVGRNVQIVQLLLQLGANANSEGGYYGSALRAAVCFRNEPIVRLLLHAGADVNILGGRSGSALQEAVKGGHLGIAHLLRLHGAKDVKI